MIRIPIRTVLANRAKTTEQNGRRGSLAATTGIFRISNISGLAATNCFSIYP
jgi:hypothetical protein